MRLKITPKMKASMEATHNELVAAKKDAAFSSDLDALVLRYDAQELIASLFAKPSYVKRFSMSPMRQQVSFCVEFGAGRPTQVTEKDFAFA